MEASVCTRIFPNSFFKELCMMHKVICFLALAIVFYLEGQPPSDPRTIRDFYKEYNYYGEPLNRRKREINPSWRN